MVRAVLRALFLAAPACALSACLFAIYIDVDAYEEDGAILFDDPNRSWFTSHCVVYVTVTRVDGEQDIPNADRVFWSASRAGSGCLAEAPFRYGETEAETDPDRFVAPKDLVAGGRYEIEVELTNGAGSGSFAIRDDGTLENLD